MSFIQSIVLWQSNCVVFVSSEEKQEIMEDQNMQARRAGEKKTEMESENDSK
jgi:hypothetical protein